MCELGELSISATLLVNGTIHTTPNHPFLVDGRWVRADQLRVGDVGQHVELEPITGEVTVMPTPITSLESSQATSGIYNFEVATYHTYIVNGLVVHNICTL
jgi:intein/homing endonuclease